MLKARCSRCSRRATQYFLAEPLCREHYVAAKRKADTNFRADKLRYYRKVSIKY